jgi:hypothetical protein
MADELRRHALRLPGAAEGIACAGTPLECPTVTAGGKTFVFLADTEIRLKLRAALSEAEALAAAEPGRYAVGAHGWVTIGQPIAPAELDRLTEWVEESFRLIAAKKLVAQLPTRD